MKLFLKESQNGKHFGLRESRPRLDRGTRRIVVVFQRFERFIAEQSRTRHTEGRLIARSFFLVVARRYYAATRQIHTLMEIRRIALHACPRTRINT